jgi:crossover junction endodeoxyribonuclease RuvC
MSRVILGVDPGLTRCGVAVINSGSARKVSLVHVDTLKSSPSTELSERLAFIADGVEALIVEHKPSVIAIERVFSQSNLKSVMGVAQISGVVMYLAKKHGIAIQMHTPSEVKAAVTGSGRAQKMQIGLAVSKILGLAEIPKPADSADAIAIAICNAWRGLPAQSGALQSRTSAQEAWLAAERVAARKPKG